MAPARAAMQLRGESSARSSANSKQVKRAGEVRRGADLRFLLQGVARREGLEPPTARSVVLNSPSAAVIASVFAGQWLCGFSMEFAISIVSMLSGRCCPSSSPSAESYLPAVGPDATSRFPASGCAPASIRRTSPRPPPRHSKRHRAAPPRPLAVPGRQAGQLLTPATLGALIRDLGVPTVTARPAALRQLVLQAPAPGVARALGFPQITAHRAVVETGGTRSRYAPAARIGHHDRSGSLPENMVRRPRWTSACSKSLPRRRPGPSASAGQVLGHSQCRWLATNACILLLRWAGKPSPR